MIGDIRISTGLLTNKKIKRLIRRKGSDGLLGLISLWIYTATHRPKGILYDMDNEDLMDACNTNDEHFISLLIDLKLIDFDGKNHSIHNWKDNNGWVFFSDERSEKAKKAAEARWNKQDKNQQHNATSNTGSNASSNAPSPTPTPTPTPKSIITENTLQPPPAEILDEQTGEIIDLQESVKGALG